MPLNEKAIHALGQMGYVLRTRELRRFDQMWDGKGESFFWLFLEREQQRRILADRWFPVLSAYAADCRRRAPAPASGELTPVKREQLRVLREQMTAFVTSSADLEPLSNPQRVVLITTMPVGMPAALAVFAPLSLRTVVLTDPEAEHWFQTQKEATLCDPWWFVHYRWVIRDRLDERDRDLIASYGPPPPGSANWLLTEGVALGGVPYSAEHRIWRWDGEGAVFLGSLGVQNFF
jgi:hypothetical protein